MVLLTGLVIDGWLHGQGYGRGLLIDAPGHAITAGSRAAARVIGVDLNDENTCAFYNPHRRHSSLNNLTLNEFEELQLTHNQTARS